MTPPRHLWSGDWRGESAAAAEGLAQRRVPSEAPSGSPPPSPSRWTAAASPAVARLRSLRAHPTRGAVLTALAMVISVASGYAIVSSLVSNGGGHPPAATSASGASPRPAVAAPAAPAWLGVDTADLPAVNGAVVINVLPGSPAEAAGLQPGDVITHVNNRSVPTAADLEALLAGMNAGDRAEIQYERGPVTAITQATLALRPANGP